MKRYLGPVLACLLIICLSSACERKYDPWNPDVAFSEALPDIPASYGELEAVTTVPQYPGWFQMWFQDEAGTIRIVRVQIFTNQMPAEIKVINRSGAAPKEVTEDEG